MQFRRPDIRNDTIFLRAPEILLFSTRQRPSESWTPGRVVGDDGLSVSPRSSGP
ncbi:hypothetical protein [Methylobacterium frigidaeris]|uniref:Uncharacterized protein n=1 Tax=Methylobacterium frigidaeris TaxID=2038277 RepID=A0AA37M406_9HYPH|nr:hypothetical protein [Methylobacterium frigidaeris]GJD61942.1 hypothetical protein MPEAHAMD_2091 [Methylobacterium frigidaeris]